MPSSAVTLGGIPLLPAPYINSNYDYIKSGQYIIGGFLIISLEGTLVGEDIINQIENINSIASNTNCADIVIGCDGSNDFISGSGKISNISINVTGDAPFKAAYTISIALETVNGSPAVSPDPEFLSSFGLSNINYLKAYEEQIGIEGDATIVGYYDSVLDISKSFIKATGSISITCAKTNVCGQPGFDGIQQALDAVKKRFSQLTSFSFTQSGHPLSYYSGWSKWLDSKSITIDDVGTVSCTFDIYMNKGLCTPIAHIDFNTEDRRDLTKSSQITSRTANGTIKGLSSSTIELLENKTSVNERMTNANSAYNLLEKYLRNASWPANNPPNLTGESASNLVGLCSSNNCSIPQQTLYFDRLSSSVSKNLTAGEITFSAEFGPVSECGNELSVSSTLDIENSVARYKEFIIPNAPEPVIQIMGNTPNKVNISVQGTINNCDQSLKSELADRVDSRLDAMKKPYLSWLKTSKQISESKFSYKITESYIECYAN